MNASLWIKTLEHLPPIHHHLGGHNIHWNDKNTELTIHYTALESFTNPRGTVEGGMICAMLDDVMGLFAYLANDRKPATTINLTMDFFKTLCCRRSHYKMPFH